MLFLSNNLNRSSLTMIAYSVSPHATLMPNALSISTLSWLQVDNCDDRGVIFFLHPFVQSDSSWGFPCFWTKLAHLLKSLVIAWHAAIKRGILVMLDKMGGTVTMDIPPAPYSAIVYNKDLSLADGY